MSCPRLTYRHEDPARNNAEFLSVLDHPTRTGILDAVAVHYGTKRAEILSELIGEGAEHLLEYLTEPTRTKVLGLMQERGFASVSDPEKETGR